MEPKLSKANPISYLPIAVRAFSEPAGRRKGRQKGKNRSRINPSALFFDLETSTDPAQKLNFGSYWWGYPDTLQTIDEGVIYGDDLPERYPDGYECLVEHVSTRERSVITGRPAELAIRSRREFVDKVFWQAAHQSQAEIVGFNLPFDLSRLATGWGIARGGLYGGGFSFRIWDYKNKAGKCVDHLYRPRLCIKHLDSRRAFVGFKRPSRVDPDYVYCPGYFRDLKTLASALTNKPGSLAKFCDIFRVEHGKEIAKQHGLINPEYIEYNFRDLLATFELFQKTRHDFQLHPIDLEAHKVYSSATIGKKYLAGMNVVPPRKKFRNLSPEKLGKIMSAYFGGRAECRIRGIVPCVYCDFKSMYPTVNALLGIWDILTAAKIKIVDVTEEFRDFLASITLEDCFKKEVWQRLNVFACILPDDDVLPVRAKYDDASDALNIGLNNLTSRKPLYYAAPDLVATTLLMGKPPKIERAIRIVPIGKQPELRPIKLRSSIIIDPANQDLFCALPEERARVKQRPKNARRDADESFLKVMANSICYGVYAEMNPQEGSKVQQVSVYGLDGKFNHRSKKPEEPGEYCFPPIAALTAAGARVMLALLERCVTDQGGYWASCDTDSMTIVATEKGGHVPIKVGEGAPYQTELIKALSWDAVDTIVARFESLNPYDKKVVSGSILKIEDENFEENTRTRVQLYGYFLAAKRYVLFNDLAGKVTIRKRSEHGLGHLLNPIDVKDPSREWIDIFWQQLIADELGRPTERPAWFEQPAISQETITTPRTLKPFLQGKRRLPYSEQMKPMNFVSSAHIMPLGHPVGVNPKKCHLIAPFSSDPQQWLREKWTDVHSKRSFHITTRANAGPNVARVKPIDDVFNEHKLHPESKSAGPDGAPCGPNTRGVLSRRSVHAAYVVSIGKESNKLEEVEHQEIHDLDEVLEFYSDPKADPWFVLVVPIMRLIAREKLAKIAGVTERSIQALRNGRSKPSAKTRAALTRAAGDFARAQMGRDIRDDLCACAALIDCFASQL